MNCRQDCIVRERPDVPVWRADLDEAYEIAERSSMKLYRADIHFRRARFLKDRKALKAAAALIKKTARHCRDEELADLKQAAKTWSSPRTDDPT